MCSNILRGHINNRTREIHKLEKAIIERIRFIIDKVDMSRMREVLEFNVRLGEALEQRSLEAMQELHKDVMRFPS